MERIKREKEEKVKTIESKKDLETPHGRMQASTSPTRSLQPYPVSRPSTSSTLCMLSSLS